MKKTNKINKLDSVKYSRMAGNDVRYKYNAHGRVSEIQDGSRKQMLNYDEMNWYSTNGGDKFAYNYSRFLHWTEDNRLDAVLGPKYFLQGTHGDSINVMLSAAAFNLKKGNEHPQKDERLIFASLFCHRELASGTGQHRMSLHRDAIPVGW